MSDLISKAKKDNAELATSEASAKGRKLPTVDAPLREVIFNQDQPPQEVAPPVVDRINNVPPTAPIGSTTFPPLEAPGQPPSVLPPDYTYPTVDRQGGDPPTIQMGSTPFPPLEEPIVRVNTPNIDPAALNSPIGTNENQPNTTVRKPRIDLQEFDPQFLRSEQSPIERVKTETPFEVAQNVLTPGTEAFIANQREQQRATKLAFDSLTQDMWTTNLYNPPAPGDVLSQTEEMRRYLWRQQAYTERNNAELLQRIYQRSMERYNQEKGQVGSVDDGFDWVRTIIGQRKGERKYLSPVTYNKTTGQYEGNFLGALLYPLGVVQNTAVGAALDARSVIRRVGESLPPWWRNNIGGWVKRFAPPMLPGGIDPIVDFINRPNKYDDGKSNIIEAIRGAQYSFSDDIGEGVGIGNKFGFKVGPVPVNPSKLAGFVGDVALGAKIDTLFAKGMRSLGITSKAFPKNVAPAVSKVDDTTKVASGAVTQGPKASEANRMAGFNPRGALPPSNRNAVRVQIVTPAPAAPVALLPPAPTRKLPTVKIRGLLPGAAKEAFEARRKLRITPKETFRPLKPVSGAMQSQEAKNKLQALSTMLSDEVEPLLKKYQFDANPIWMKYSSTLTDLALALNISDASLATKTDLVKIAAEAGSNFNFLVESPYGNQVVEFLGELVKAEPENVFKWFKAVDPPLETIENLIAAGKARGINLKPLMNGYEVNKIAKVATLTKAAKGAVSPASVDDIVEALPSDTPVSIQSLAENLGVEKADVAEGLSQLVKSDAVETSTVKGAASEGIKPKVGKSITHVKLTKTGSAPKKDAGEIISETIADIPTSGDKVKDSLAKYQTAKGLSDELAKKAEDTYSVLDKGNDVGRQPLESGALPDSFEPPVVPIKGLPFTKIKEGKRYHGTKVKNLVPAQIDAIQGSARNELGAGYYTFPNKAKALLAANADSAINLPNVPGREMGDVGQIIVSNVKEGWALDALKPSSQLPDIARQVSVGLPEVEEALKKVPPNPTYVQMMDIINTSVGEEVGLVFQRRLAQSLKKSGVKAIKAKDVLVNLNTSGMYADEVISGTRKSSAERMMASRVKLEKATVQSTGSKFLEASLEDSQARLAAQQTFGGVQVVKSAKQQVVEAVENSKAFDDPPPVSELSPTTTPPPATIDDVVKRYNNGGVATGTSLQYATDILWGKVTPRKGPRFTQLVKDILSGNIDDNAILQMLDTRYPGLYDEVADQVLDDIFLKGPTPEITKAIKKAKAAEVDAIPKGAKVFIDVDTFAVKIVKASDVVKSSNNVEITTTTTKATAQYAADILWGVVTPSKGPKFTQLVKDILVGNIDGDDIIRKLDTRYPGLYDEVADQVLDDLVLGVPANDVAKSLQAGEELLDFSTPANRPFVDAYRKALNGIAPSRPLDVVIDNGVTISKAAADDYRFFVDATNPSRIRVVSPANATSFIGDALRTGDDWVELPKQSAGIVDNFISKARQGTPDILNQLDDEAFERGFNDALNDVQQKGGKFSDDLDPCG